MRKIQKSDLRELARGMYERNGARVSQVSGRGLIPGSRLKISIGSDERLVVVRTSLDREVSLTRRPNGELATIPNADEVAIVVPSTEDPGFAEMLSFDKATIIAAFELAVRMQRERYPNLSPKAPIFIALDGARGQPGGANAPPLKDQAQWTKKVPLDLAPIQKRSAPESMSEFRERVLREFAELQGLPTSDVAIDFRILSRPRISKDEEN